MRAQPLDLLVVQHRADRTDVGAGALDLPPEPFLLDAIGARLDQHVAHRVEPRDDDVLAAVERGGILGFLVSRELHVALGDQFGLLLHLTGQPLRALLEARDLERQILVDVIFGEGIDGARGEFRIRGVERHVDQLAAANLRDMQLADQRVAVARGLDRRGVGQRGLRTRGGRYHPIRHGRVALDDRDGLRQLRRLGSLAVEFRDVLKVEFSRHARRQVAAAHDAQLRLQVDLGIGGRDVARDFGRGGDVAVRILDQHLRPCAVNRDLRVAVDHHPAHHQREHRDGGPAVLVEHREAIKEVRIPLRPRRVRHGRERRGRRRGRLRSFGIGLGRNRIAGISRRDVRIDRHRHGRGSH